MAGHHTRSFEGPLCWAVTTAAGALAGLGLALIAPAVHADGHPVVPLWLATPFVLLLLSIALMPFISEKIWHHHFPDFSFFLGAVVLVYYIVAYGKPDASGHSFGWHAIHHVGLEYFSFIALIGGLYVASGGIVIDTRGTATPRVNTILLAAGAILANIVGTTGASVLLIRPFIRSNKGRITPLHVVFFIFIVSNCGGSLTPIGDPPLFLGYIKGVPFEWTLIYLWKPWLVVVGALLLLFFLYDTGIQKKLPKDVAAASTEGGHGFSIRGAGGFIALGIIVACVFLDPFLSRQMQIHLPVPIGPFLQIAVAIAAFKLAPKAYHEANGFSLFPVKEVGLLFIGIFLTMMPALAYLAAHAPGWGITSPTAYYFLTGGLSAGLDNAPTYLSFLQIAFGETPINPQTIAEFIRTPEGILKLEAISLGAVFFGAMTYIGNGPNFMVRAIANSSNVTMPSFFGYIGWAAVILLPVLVLNWFIFIR
ncbi:MAG TPA: sodium:proton antiporter [Phycisphaerales bacterium]|nr:sodium:proton antiporter [Phycisphaerales bacterium]